MWVVVTVVTVVVLIATYVTWTASRVDRLHARAASAFAALDAQSIRRAAAAAEVGQQRGMPVLRGAAKAVLAAQTDERLAAENDLTRALRSASAELGPEALALVDDASRRLALARQLHTDSVRDALAVRRQPMVRMLRLSRRHPQPLFFDIDEPALDGPAEPGTRRPG